MNSNLTSNHSAFQNIQLAWHVLNELSQLGVTEFCVCPGARNAPWVALLAENHERFRCFYFFEERSAAFFALGRIRRTGSPVGVITTSGTAVGELLPATMEGHYSGLPLILLTADRPSRYRGSGAPQAAEQVGIFGPYVSRCWDLEGNELPGLGEFPLESPWHINCCFEEPILGSGLSLKWENWDQSRTDSRGLPRFDELLSVSAGEKQKIRDFVNQVRFPIAIVGYLPHSDREAVVQLLRFWRIPCYLEALSGLREDPRLAAFRVHSPDRWMEQGAQSGYLMDGVVRLGGIPTLRFWRDLDSQLSHFPVLSLSGLKFSGLARASTLVKGGQGRISELCQALQLELESGALETRLMQNQAKDKFLEMDHALERALRGLFIEEPTSEPGMIAALSERISKGSAVYLGNSLPIREWDLAATREDRSYDIWASRGLNGIDGQVSTFLGFASPEKENWALLGDLTTLYDLPGPWILPQLPEIQSNLVVINNQGGKIFSRMFPYSEFQNCHQIRFQSWAQLWGLSYESWTEVPPLDQGMLKGGAPELPNSGRHRLIELLPDEAATQRFWEKLKKL